MFFANKIKFLLSANSDVSLVLFFTSVLLAALCALLYFKNKRLKKSDNQWRLVADTLQSEKDEIRNEINRFEDKEGYIYTTQRWVSSAKTNLQRLRKALEEMDKNSCILSQSSDEDKIDKALMQLMQLVDAGDDDVIVANGEASYAKVLLRHRRELQLELRKLENETDSYKKNLAIAANITKAAMSNNGTIPLDFMVTASILEASAHNLIQEETDLDVQLPSLQEQVVHSGFNDYNTVKKLLYLRNAVRALHDEAGLSNVFVANCSDESDISQILRDLQMHLVASSPYIDDVFLLRNEHDSDLYSINAWLHDYCIQDNKVNHHRVEEVLNYVCKFDPDRASQFPSEYSQATQGKQASAKGIFSPLSEDDHDFFSATFKEAFSSGALKEVFSSDRKGDTETKSASGVIQPPAMKHGRSGRSRRNGRNRRIPMTEESGATAPHAVFNGNVDLAHISQVAKNDRSKNQEGLFQALLQEIEACENPQEKAFLKNYLAQNTGRSYGYTDEEMKEALSERDTRLMAISFLRIKEMMAELLRTPEPKTKKRAPIPSKPKNAHKDTQETEAWKP